MNFVIAVDGSEESKEAVNYAVELVPESSRLTVVHAVTPEIYTQDNDVLIEDMSDAEARAEDVLEDAVETASDTGKDLSVEYEMLYGDPVESIVDYAESGEYDGIFVGHKGISQKHQDMVGSVTQNLVRKATLPVTVVR
ncbi:MAG: universal stress protein [Halobacteria archaeon]